MSTVSDRPSYQQVYALLSQRDLRALVDLCEKDRRLWRILWGGLYDAEDNLRWPAIEAVARVLVGWWKAGQEKRVREYIRRLTWSFNDEAGELIWSAPEAIAEIAVAVPELYEPYGDMMISLASEEPLLVPGVLWGIGRLGPKARKAVEHIQDRIVEVFDKGDHKTIGLAAWAMGEAGFGPALPYLEALKGRKEPVRIYFEGEFHERPVGQWAQEAIGKIDNLR